MRAKRLIAVIFGIALTFSGCQKQARVSAPPVPAAPLSPPRIVAVLDQADRAFSEGNYDAALQSYEESLRLSPAADQRERALFRLGLAYVLRSTNPDWDRAAATLKKFVEEYPDSALKPPAILIISLRSEVDQLAADTRARDQRIRQLSTELEKLKQIDVQRRTRP